MKTFKGNKSIETIRAQCEKEGVHFCDEAYRVAGSDCVVLSSTKHPDALNHNGRVWYNTTNGNFFGFTPDGVKFYSHETKHENEEWFQKLLSFFYVE